MKQKDLEKEIRKDPLKFERHFNRIKNKIIVERLHKMLEEVYLNKLFRFNPMRTQVYGYSMFKAIEVKVRPHHYSHVEGRGFIVKIRLDYDFSTPDDLIDILNENVHPISLTNYNKFWNSPKDFRSLHINFDGIRRKILTGRVEIPPDFLTVYE